MALFLTARSRARFLPARCSTSRPGLQGRNSVGSGHPSVLAPARHGPALLAVNFKLTTAHPDALPSRSGWIWNGPPEPQMPVRVSCSGSEKAPPAARFRVAPRTTRGRVAAVTATAVTAPLLDSISSPAVQLSPLLDVL